jgi:hypothetical protein
LQSARSFASKVGNKTRRIGGLLKHGVVLAQNHACREVRLSVQTIGAIKVKIRCELTAKMQGKK